MSEKMKLIAGLLLIVGMVLLFLYTGKSYRDENSNSAAPKEEQERIQIKAALTESDYNEYNKVFMDAHNSVVMHQYGASFDPVSFEEQIQTLRDIRERIVNNATRENLSPYELKLLTRGIDRMIKVLELYLDLLQTRDTALLERWEDAFNEYLDHADEVTERPDLLEQNAALREWPAVFKQNFIRENAER